MRPLPDQCFPQEWSALQELFGNARVTESLPRLRQIYEYTEEIWDGYLNLLRGDPVRFLLIAEAPPWSDAGPPQYVLDPDSRSRTLMKALRKAFLPPAMSEQLAPEDALAEFARQGLLVVDSIPFPMEYTKKRKSLKYDNLVQLTARSYLLTKLCTPSLCWSPNLLVAFSVKLNALAVIRGLGGKLRFGAVEVALGREQVAVNDAGYPDAAKLRALYDLPNNAE